jgi:hypothetical protein
MKELDSEDEYYDRTKKQTNQNNSVSNKKEQSVITENYETLKVKLEALIKNRQRLVDKLQNLKSTSSNGDKKQAETEIDSLDAFISETNTQIASQQKTVTTQEINDLTNEINKTQKLLSLVTPSHLKLKQSSNEINVKEYYKKEKFVIPEAPAQDKTDALYKIAAMKSTISTVATIIPTLSVVNLNQSINTTDESENIDSVTGINTQFVAKINEGKSLLNGGNIVLIKKIGIPEPTLQTAQFMNTKTFNSIIEPSAAGSMLPNPLALVESVAITST